MIWFCRAAPAQIQMAAQLTGIDLPGHLRSSLPGSPRQRIPVKPLINGMALPPLGGQTTPRTALRAQPKKSPPSAVEYVPPPTFDLTKLEPAVKLAWQKLHERFKENMSYVSIAFKRADSDSSGRLSRFELHSVLLSFRVEGMTHNVISKLIDIADKDGDGEINYKEFVRLIKAGVPDDEKIVEHQQRFTHEREREILHVKRRIAERIEAKYGKMQLQHAFRKMDLSKNNKLERYEIKTFLHENNLVPEMISDHALDGLLSVLDVDGDGEINYAEFCRLIWADDESLESMRRDVRKN